MSRDNGGADMTGDNHFDEGHPDKGQPDEARLDRLVDFGFEMGWLRKTPRSGWIYLGRGKEDVAQHSFRTAMLAFTLARMAGADARKAAVMALFHDIHEARVGDLNYMNQRYVTTDGRRAQWDAVAGTGFEDEVVGLFDEFEERGSVEAMLCKDADQLDLLFNLKEELDKGCEFARDWIEPALKRLKTAEGKALARKMLEVDHNRWWFGRVDPRWWVERSPETRGEQETPGGGENGTSAGIDKA